MYKLKHHGTVRPDEAQIWGSKNAVAAIAGTKERYSGKAYETKELVEKAKLDIVVFRYGQP